MKKILHKCCFTKEIIIITMLFLCLSNTRSYKISAQEITQPINEMNTTKHLDNTKLDYLNNTTTEDVQYNINNELLKHVEVSQAENDINKTIDDISDTINDLKKEKYQKDKEKKLEQQKRLEELMEKEPENVPNDEKGCNSLAKTYMAYTTVTSTSSPQYKLLNSKDAHTDDKTGIRMYKDRYCIALGSFYASKIGTKVNLQLENGTIIKCILGDQKSNRHTDPTHRFHKKDGSVAEFIIDNKIFSKVKDSSGTVNFVKGWKSKIIKVIKIK